MVYDILHLLIPSGDRQQVSHFHLHQQENGPSKVGRNAHHRTIAPNHENGGRDRLVLNSGRSEGNPVLEKKHGRIENYETS